MEAMTTLSRSGPLTRAELDALPDDGRRHELVDGVLVVTPAPRPVHQAVVLSLATHLASRQSSDLKTFVAPIDVVIDDTTVLQPDVLVARRSDLGEMNLPVAPLLAVEVLSPTTRSVDLLLKKARYEAAGCASYWVVDPDILRLVAWDLVEGTYVEVADVSGEETFEARLPFPVSLAPRDLVD